MGAPHCGSLKTQQVHHFSDSILMTNSLLSVPLSVLEAWWRTRAGKSDFPALMMTNWKLMITASEKSLLAASPMKTCFIWMKMGKLNLESSTSNCVLSTFHIILFANLVKKNLRQNRCKCASVSVIMKIYAASQSDPQTRTENAEQDKIQDLASEYWLNS